MANIYGTSGADNLTGTALNDNLYGYAPGGAGLDTGDDTLTSNAGNDRLFGGGGNDTLAGGAGNDGLYGGVGDDTLDGGAGNDNLFGFSGSDTLYGGDATDLLDGGEGADTMAGGRGNDTYILDNVSDVVIEDTVAGVDTVECGFNYTLGANIERLIFTGTGDFVGAGNSGANYIQGKDGNDHLLGGDGDDILDSFAGDDLLEGGAGNGSIFAGEGSDTILGGAGNDSMYSWFGGGVDIMIGGAGDDQYTVYDLDDVVTEEVNSGLDKIIALNVSWTLGANFEILEIYDTGAIGGSPVDGTGNALDNIITGSGARNILDGGAGNDAMWGRFGDDTVTGGLGDDTLNGGAGADALSGGDGIDTLDYSPYYDYWPPAGITVDIGKNTASGGDAQGDILSGFENLIGSPYDDTLTGSALANVITGGAGADTMTGLAGDDIYWVDNVGDVVVENRGGGTDFVHSSISYALAADVENLTLEGKAPADGTGNALDNAITGNSANNIIDGGLGADTMTGGSGDDTFVVDNAGDLVSDTRGIDSVISNIDYVLGMALENLTLTGAAINGIGNRLANVIAGNAENNELRGSGGDDTMSGGGGADLLDGGSGADAMGGGAGDDTYYADNSGDSAAESVGEGFDTVRSAVSFTLGVEVEQLVLRGTANINGAGNSLDNVLWGNFGSNRLDGGAGNDRLLGGAGIDTLVGGEGDDTYVTDTARDIVAERAGGGNDTIESQVSKALVAYVENLALRGANRINGFGNALDNAISGNGQMNLLDGKEGADSLTGGAGRDSFAFTTALGAGNIDTVTDFRVIDDTIRLDDAIFSAIGATGWLSAAAFFAGAAAHDADDRILYDSATGALLYDADGTGAAAAQQFATLAAGLALTNADIFVV
jgi:Ca2+-binding RTX toxin-like protein